MSSARWTIAVLNSGAWLCDGCYEDQYDPSWETDASKWVADYLHDGICSSCGVVIDRGSVIGQVT